MYMSWILCPANLPSFLVGFSLKYLITIYTRNHATRRVIDKCVHVRVCTHIVLVGRWCHNGLHNSSHVYTTHVCMYIYVHVLWCTCTCSSVTCMCTVQCIWLMHVNHDHFSGLELFCGCLFVKVILMNLWHHFLSTQIRIKCVIEEY